MNAGIDERGLCNGLCAAAAAAAAGICPCERGALVQQRPELHAVKRALIGLACAVAGVGCDAGSQAVEEGGAFVAVEVQEREVVGSDGSDGAAVTAAVVPCQG